MGGLKEEEKENVDKDEEEVSKKKISFGSNLNLNMIETVSSFKMRGSALCICHQQLWQERISKKALSQSQREQEQNRQDIQLEYSSTDDPSTIDVIGEAFVTLACLNSTT